MLREQKKVVIKAISDLGYRVTAADVASKTGLSLSESNFMLNQIASEAGGHLEVSQAGDIAYRFKSNFQGTYLATGIKAFFTLVFDKLFAFFFYLVKISFGIFLALSLIIVIFAFIIIAVLSSQMGSQRRDFNLGELLEFFNFLIFRDLLFFGSVKAQAHLTKRQPDNTKGNFFINCFSFLFGDGDPNAHLEEHKWQLAAQAIRDNGGVVIKEQLAPYVGPSLDDENKILPLLTRFEGKPAVTSNGNIAYIFPSLQVTTELQNRPRIAAPVVEEDRPSYLQEEYWKFSKLSGDALKPVYIVAGLNLFGSIWMFYIFNYMFHFKLIWTEIMVFYGAMFFVIPALRTVWQAGRNAQIRARNNERREAAKRVNRPDAVMQAKLNERLEFAASAPLRAVEADHLVFTTERENLEQQIAEGEKDNLQDFSP